MLVPDARGESRAAGSRQPATCLGNRTTSGSSPLGGLAARRKGKGSPSSLDGDATKFQAWPVGALVLTVQVEELSEEQQAGLLSKVDFAEHLEVAYIGHRIGSYVLWPQVKEIQHVSKEL